MEPVLLDGHHFSPEPFVNAIRESTKQAANVHIRGLQQVSSADANLLAIKEEAKQYDVARHAGTERPFQNVYWDYEPDRIYVDVFTGEPLFSSRDMYSSGTRIH